MFVWIGVLWIFKLKIFKVRDLIEIQVKKK